MTANVWRCSGRGVVLALVATWAICAWTRADDPSGNTRTVSGQGTTEAAAKDTEKKREPSFSLRVRLKVETNDDDTRSLIESVVKRELRALGDVEAVDELANYEIEIVCVENTVAGRRTGFAISTVVHSPMDVDSFGKILDISIRPDANKDTTKELLLGFAKRRTRIETHELRIVPSDRLAKSCEAIVAEMDTKLFEFDRKVHRRLSDSKQQERRPPKGSD